MKTSKFAFGKSKYFATHKLLRCSRPDVFCKIICNFTKKVTKKILLKKTPPLAAYDLCDCRTSCNILSLQNID